MNDELIPLYRFWQPRFWPLWVGIVLMRLIVLLPQSLRMAIGRGIGRLVQRFAKDRNKVVKKNIDLCFPELSKEERATIVTRHFESLGMSVIELGMVWMLSDAEIQRLIKIEGQENIQAALEAGKGALLFTGHMASAEFTGRATKPLLPPIAAMYRPSNNPFTDQVMRRCRMNVADTLITKTGIRQLLKSLKANEVVWYAADQAYTGKGMAVVPFFNQPAATNTAVSSICRLSKTPLVPFFPYREDNGKSYRVEFLPELENFPSGDDVADATRLNKLLEDNIRKAPEQYYWVHRRFKGRPDNHPDPYE
jgi:KDO2-lipid IV(A) lauroyltransferase